MAGPQTQVSWEILALLTASLVVLAVEHAKAIRWLALHSSLDSAWNSTSACRQARQSLQLSKRQTRICRSSPDAMVQVARAASAAISTCQRLLEDRRWNCSSTLLAPHFTPDLSTGTREQAFVYALSSAAVTHALARACAAGALPYCSCASLPQDPPDGHFKWGGCGDNLRWASVFARLFAADGGGSRAGLRYRQRMGSSNSSSSGREIQQRAALSLVNIHNSRVGRRVVEDSLLTQCKCHGVSGSCSVRTCWRALPPRLIDVGERLLRRYPEAVHVTSGTAEGRRLLSVRPGLRYTHDDMLFLSQSPDYCHRDYRVGSIGTYGRKCNSSSSGYVSCANMCCGRGYKTRVEERVWRCNCKYYWCCYVKCKTCRSWEQVQYCN